MRSFGFFCDPLWSIYFDYKLVLFMVNLLFYFFNFCLSGTKYGYRCLQQNIRTFYTIKFFSNYFTWDLCVSVNWLSTYSDFAGLLARAWVGSTWRIMLHYYSLYILARRIINLECPLVIICKMFHALQMNNYNLLVHEKLSHPFHPK